VRNPNLNAYSERWVRSVKEECLLKVLLIGERSLRLGLSEYVTHYHAERNHQLHLCKANYAAGKRPGVTELRGRPVKPRRPGQQSTRFNSFNRSLGIF
jgi:Integrase core domain